MQLLYTFGRKCIPDDFQYEYTECDENGQRWRVVVPKMNNLECDDGVPLPIRGVNCCLFFYFLFIFFIIFYN